MRWGKSFNHFKLAAWFKQNVFIDRNHKLNKQAEKTTAVCLSECLELLEVIPRVTARQAWQRMGS